MSSNVIKKRRTTEDAAPEDGPASTAKDAEIAELKATVATLQRALKNTISYETTLYASSLSHEHPMQRQSMPKHGMNPRHIKELLEGIHDLDNQPSLNTSSYVNVVYEPEERAIAMMGATVNLADASVYPASVSVHDRAVDWIASLWHCPKPSTTKTPPTGGSSSRAEHFSGSATVGSTEACLLAGLAHKFRWRKWYGERHGLSKEQVLGVRPNLVMSSCFQAAWEKFFKYFDVQARFIKPSIHTFTLEAAELAELCDDKTMAVVGILGNHYNGAYDPIWEMDAVISKVNADQGFQIGIHVDAASGGFVAPFQDDMPDFDFRLPNVLSISASGHKFGESICGTGWVVFRQREDLTEHIAISVSYLGGHCDSITLNFSRPASGCYVQLYKFMRLGIEGYRSKVDNQMAVSAFIRSKLASMKRPDGKPRFELLDNGDTKCLPVVAARLNNADGCLKYDDIDFQHALAEFHWYVSGYGLTFENLARDGAHESLFRDASITATMFRIVCKSNLTMSLAEDLIYHIEEVLPALDSHGFQSVKKTNRFRDLVEQVMKAQPKAAC